MRKKVKTVCNVPDFKNREGAWVTTYNITTDLYYIQHWTRAFRLWVKINGRCSDTGYISNARPSYDNCRNDFKDFQSFASWCNQQKGYYCKDVNGKFWSIDKDILGDGSVYSPTTCCFIPNSVNQIFTKKWDGKFSARKQKSIIKVLQEPDLELAIKEAVLQKWVSTTGDTRLEVETVRGGALVRKKFKVLYPKDHHDQTKAGTEYKPIGMLAMNKDGVFFETVDRGWEGWSFYKLSEILYRYDVVWED